MVHPYPGSADEGRSHGKIKTAMIEILGPFTWTTGTHTAAPVPLAMLGSAIEAVLKDCSEKRLDYEMKASPFKVWMTFRRYYPEGTSQYPVGPIEEYYLKQALALAPFMTDTSSLPENAKKVLVKMDRPLVLPPSK